jgi:hypothetical protein
VFETIRPDEIARLLFGPPVMSAPPSKRMVFVLRFVARALWAPIVDVLAFVKHWMLEPTNTWSLMEILEFTRIRCVVFKELSRNIVLAVVNVPARFKLLWTFTGPTIVAEDRIEVPSATNRLLRLTRFDELYRVLVTKVETL